MNTVGQAPPVRAKRSIFLPLVLLAAAVVGMVLSDVYQGLQRRAALAERINSLESSVADANRVRRQFDTLTTGVAQLALAGNANARAVMAQLNKAGVNVEPGQ